MVLELNSKDYITHVTGVDKASKHWIYCEKNRIPYIIVNNVNNVNNVNDSYVEIFYDVTNFNIDLESISTHIQSLILSYYDFFVVAPLIFENYTSQLYFFRFAVKEEHYICIVDQLFIYLLNKINQKPP